MLADDKRMELVMAELQALKVDELSPLSPQVIERQATINIGKFIEIFAPLS